MIELLRASVEPNECDVMGHLNVRHYFGRAFQGLTALGRHAGLGPRAMREQGLRFVPRTQHIRFHRELRPGAAYRMQGGVLSTDERGVVVYAELLHVHARDGETVAATAITEAALFGGHNGGAQTGAAVPLSSAQRDALSALTVELPAHGAPRGITPAPPRPAPTLQEAEDLGMVGAYLGPVESEECDAEGFMLPAGFMGRISNGIRHFFAKSGMERRDGMGGAALEYRFVFHGQPRRGDWVEVRSGLKSVERKTRHFCHWVFDLDSGACVATSHGVAVVFDLQARRAVAISDGERAQLERLAIPSLRL